MEENKELKPDQMSGEGTISGPGVKPAGKSRTPLLIAVFVFLVIVTFLLLLV